RFRYQFAGKEKMLSLGTFPEVSLSAAREMRRDARKLVADGIDPSQHRKEEKIAANIAAANTFALLLVEHLKNLEVGRAASSALNKIRCPFEHPDAPHTKSPKREIKPAEILDILKKVEKSGRRETARRLRGAIGNVFRVAIQTLSATNDPTFPLRGSLQK